MRRLWRFLSGGPQRRHLLVGGLLAGSMLAMGACNIPTSGAGNGPSSVYIGGGALNAQDGTTRWTGDLGSQPPILAGGVLYATASPPTTPDQPAIGIKAVRASDGKVLWTSGAAIAEGSLVLAGDRLIVPTAQVPLNQPGTLTLVALRTSDGGVLWRCAPINVQSQPTVDTREPIISNLVVSSGLVVGMFAASPSASFVAAWRLADGTLAWQQPLNDASAFAGPSGTITRTGATLTIAYSGASGEQLAGLDPVTGKSVWPAPVTGASLDLVTSSVAVISDAAAGTVTGVRLSDGTTLWRRDLGANASQRLEELNASDSTVFYRRFEPCQSQQCPVIYALSLTDGSILWHRALSPADPDYAISTAYGDGMLYYAYFYQDSSGTHYVLIALRAADGTIAWTHAVAPLSLTRAVVSDGMLYAFGTGAGASCPLRIEALRISDGSLAWQHEYTPCPRFIFATPWFLVA